MHIPLWFPHTKNTIWYALHLPQHRETIKIYINIHQQLIYLMDSIIKIAFWDDEMSRPSLARTWVLFHYKDYLSRYRYTLYKDKMFVRLSLSFWMELLYGKYGIIAWKWDAFLLHGLCKCNTSQNMCLEFLLWCILVGLETAWLCLSKIISLELGWSHEISHKCLLLMMSLSRMQWNEWLECTVETLYSTINFCWSTHKRHSIARPKGWGMGCLLWVQRATYCVDLSILSSIKFWL